MVFRDRIGLFFCIVVYSSSLLAQTMQHPGILLSKAQLDFVKAQVQAHQEPFYSQYQKAMASPYGALDYRPQGPPPTGIIDCGSYSRPDHGCHIADDDSTAAYVQALLWYITRNHRYAENAIRILNAYGHNLKGFTNHNAPLQAAWTGEMLPRGAEILRSSDAGWKPEDIAAFSQMLTHAILPLIHDGSGANGNWELSMIDATMNIAVFTNDRKLLKHAEKLWSERVPAYFYLSELDGSHPRPMPRQNGGTHWYGNTDLDKSLDGFSQETCRDFGHTGYGIAATINAAETAHIQGDKLYESEEKRLVAALEFHAKLLLDRGQPVPQNICGGTVHYAHDYTFVIGYNEFHNRLGITMPYTKQWIESSVEQAALPVDPHMMVFEALTHAEDSAGADAREPPKGQSSGRLP